MAFIGANPKFNTSTHNPQSVDPTNPTEGQTFYSDGTSRAEGLWVWKNSNWVFVEGGAADANTIELIRADDLADATTSNIDLQGNNANFDGGGTITASSLTLSTTAADLIQGITQSIKYDPNANGSNDYFGFTVDIPLGWRGRDLGISFAYKNDSTTVDNDFRFAYKIKDGAQAGTILYSNMAAFDNSNTAQTFNVAEFCPADCTQIEIGWQNTSATTTVQLIVDNIVVSSRPFVTANLLDNQTMKLHTSNGHGSTNTVIRRWTTIAENSGDTSLFHLVQSATDGDSIVIDRKGKYFFALTDNFSAGGQTGLTKNSTELTTAITSLTNTVDRISMAFIAGGNNPISISGGEDLDVGDVIRVHTAGASDGVGARSGLRISGQAETEHIITPAKSTLTDWTSYTPTTQGLGTPTFNDVRWRQVGDSIEIMAKFTTGTTTASEAQFGLPSGFTIDSTKVTVLKPISAVVRGSVSATHYHVALTGGDAFVNFTSRNGSSTSGFSPENGSTLFGNTENISFFATIPITELSSDVTFLAAIPVQKTIYLKDVKANTTAGGGFTSGSYVTRDLNTTEGNTELVTLSANQFTLGPGKYQIEASAPAYEAGLHKCKIRNITDSTDDIFGSNARASSAGGNDMSHSLLAGELEITSSKTYELQHRCSVTKASDGRGVATSFGDSEFYSIVKIVKIK